MAHSRHHGRFLCPSLHLEIFAQAFLTHRLSEIELKNYYCDIMKKNEIQIKLKS